MRIATVVKQGAVHCCYGAEVKNKAFFFYNEAAEKMINFMTCHSETQEQQRTPTLQSPKNFIESLHVIKIQL